MIFNRLNPNLYIRYPLSAYAASNGLFLCKGAIPDFSALEASYRTSSGAYLYGLILDQVVLADRLALFPNLSGLPAIGNVDGSLTFDFKLNTTLTTGATDSGIPTFFLFYSASHTQAGQTKATTGYGTMLSLIWGTVGDENSGADLRIKSGTLLPNQKYILTNLNLLSIDGAA